MSYRALVFVCLLLADSAALALGEATVEGRVELPRTRYAPVMTKRYEIVTKPGVFSTNPPLASFIWRARPDGRGAADALTGKRPGVLMREPGRVFTRTELCERVWAREHDYDTKLVEVFIRSAAQEDRDAASDPHRAAPHRLHDPRSVARPAGCT